MRTSELDRPAAAVPTEEEPVHLDLSGLLLAGTMWMLAAVIAWPWGHPDIAAALLIGQAVGFIAAAIWDTGNPPRSHRRSAPPSPLMSTSAADGRGR
jgi:hypothetical protein